MMTLTKERVAEVNFPSLNSTSGVRWRSVQDNIFGLSFMY